MATTELDPKTIATLKARAALVGLVLHVDVSGRAPPFTASKWNLVRELGSVAELEQFLQRLGSPSPESETAHVASAGRIEQQWKLDGPIVNAAPETRKAALSMTERMGAGRDTTWEEVEHA